MLLKTSNKTSKKELWTLLKQAEFIIGTNICVMDNESTEAQAARRWLKKFAEVKVKNVTK